MKKLIALLASLSVLSTMTAASASALYYKDTYEYFEITEDEIEKYGYTMHEVKETYRGGQYEKEDSIFNGYDLYHSNYEYEYDFTVENDFYKDEKDLQSRDFIVVPAEKIESFYLHVTGDPRIDGGLKKPLDSSLYEYRIYLDKVNGKNHYDVEMLKAEELFCRLTSDNNDSPVDADKLAEIAPNLRLSRTSQDKAGISNGACYKISDSDNRLDQEDIDNILKCANEHLVSFRYSHSYWLNYYYIDENNIVKYENIEKAKAIYDKHGISFTIRSLDENHGIIDEGEGTYAEFIPDEPLSGDELFNILCELADEGIALRSPKDNCCVYHTYKEPEIELIRKLAGDANDDETLSLSDAVIILQAVGNPDKYRLTNPGKAKADIVGNGDGITNADALEIQRKLLKLTD